MATWPTITDDDGSNTTGTVINNTNVWTPIQSYIGGAWTDVSFSAGNFTANNSMTWTVASGDQIAYAYLEVGKTMFLSVRLHTTTVGGTPSSELRVAVPNSRTIQSYGQGAFHYLDNGTAGTGLWLATASAAYVAFLKNASSAAWTASTDQTYIYAMCMFEID